MTWFLINRNTLAELEITSPYTTAYNIFYVIEYRTAVNTIHSVAFFQNDAFVRTENVAPYALSGDQGGTYSAWDVPKNRLTKVSIIEYSETDRQGTILAEDDLFVTFTEAIPTISRIRYKHPATTTAAGTLGYGFTISTTGTYRIVLRTAASELIPRNSVWIACIEKPILCSLTTSGSADYTIPANTFFDMYSNQGGNRFAWDSNVMNFQARKAFVNFNTSGDYTIVIAGSVGGVSLDRIALIKEGVDESTVIGVVEFSPSTITSGKAVESGGIAVADNTLVSLPVTGWSSSTATSGYYGSNAYLYDQP